MTQAAYEHNGQPVSAEAFYAIACDPRRSVAVEACAGAGKTWMLVSRMLRALLEGDAVGAEVQPHEILAITFTKKAAGEMRERLYEWLERFAHADDETLRQELVIRGVSSEITGQKGLQPNKDGREKLSNLYKQVLANGRPVQIRTFHSWFAALLRSAPMATLQQLGLPLNYELLEDDGPAKALVWRRFYAALVQDEALKADFEVVVMTHGRFQADKALRGALDKRTEFLLADAVGVVESSVKHFSEQFAEFAGLGHPDEALSANAVNQKLFMAAAGALGRASAPTFSAKGVELEKAMTEGDIRAALMALLTEKGTARKFGEKIIGIGVIREAQDLALRIVEAQLQSEAWDYQQRMARLARVLLAEFTALKRERGWVDMNDVERAASVMLSDPVLSGWVQERLDARIRHLMIDEFQDTNPLQWQALSNWLSGYAGAGGSAPSVFIVGDPKQSIYRFRRAEPQVFIAAQAFVRDALGGDLLACDHTRRSSHAVIGAVNAVMGHAAINDAYQGFRAHTSASPDEGRVLRLPPIPRAEKSQTPEALEWRDSLTAPRELLEETLRTLEARQAASWIASQMASGIQPSDVMALSRRRASLRPLLDELRVLHIPAQIGEKTELIDCCEVLDIVALLDALVSPQHDLSLARALRSPLFNLSDDALVQIVLTKGDSKLSWFEVLQNQELLAHEFVGLSGTLSRYKALLDALPPHDALQAIYDSGDVLARFAAAAPAASRGTVLSNLRALLAAALQVDGGRYATPYAFVRALKAGGLQAPAAVNPDAVRLLTIHGAKGLEAEAVLVLDTDTAPRGADSMSVLVDWPGEALAPHKFVFLISESAPPACATETLVQEQNARRREELNALYVAITRAKNTLVVSSIEPYREAPDSWWQRLHGLSDIEAIPALAVVTEPLESGGFALPELPEFVTGASPAPQPVIKFDPVAARIGKAMHRLLEFNDVSNPVVNRVAREFGLNPEQATQAQAMANCIRHGAAAWAWDASVVQWQGNEVELTHQGDTFRLDRLVQRRDAGHEGHWWVLDYKSAVSPQRQVELVIKMKTYMAAMEAIYPGQTVKAAFLTGDGQVVMVD
ncbi:MAG: UvrD-helicase domain-containing protein [Polaromonas sp.]|nr:UvrD-helicase domain-containing protein [Polaromonas sp.]